MPQIGFDPDREQRFQENRRLGSQMIVIGWILMGMNGLAFMFIFQEIRQGTDMWIIWCGVLGFIALFLIGLGTKKRRQIPE